jgi:hypothetical protein
LPLLLRPLLLFLHPAPNLVILSAAKNPRILLLLLLLSLLLSLLLLLLLPVLLNPPTKSVILSEGSRSLTARAAVEGPAFAFALVVVLAVALITRI